MVLIEQLSSGRGSTRDTGAPVTSTRHAGAPVPGRPKKPGMGATAAVAPKPRRGVDAPVGLAFAPATQFFQRYQVGDKIGSGSYGTVWRCTDKDTGAVVACKQISKKQGMASIVDEVDCFARAQGSSHVLRLEGVFESELYVYLVTELCDGGDLFEFLREHGHMEEAEAKVLFAQIAEAVHHCHTCGVIHRDIKPENVLLKTCPATGQMSARLADFGLAARLQPGETVTGWVGSEPYEAPEVMSSRPYGFSADVFSLGVVLFGMLSANWPTFSQEQGRPGQGRVFEAERNFWRRGWKAVSQDVKDLASAMMSADPEKRPSTTQILQSPWLTGVTAVTAVTVTGVTGVTAVTAVTGVPFSEAVPAEKPTDDLADVMQSWEPMSHSSARPSLRTDTCQAGSEQGCLEEEDKGTSHACAEGGLPSTPGTPVSPRPPVTPGAPSSEHDDLPSPVGSEFGLTWSHSTPSSASGSHKHRDHIEDIDRSFRSKDNIHNTALLKQLFRDINV